MRRFEKRGTEAPMDFEYENKDRDLGPGWSPFRDTFQKRPSTSSFSSQSSAFAPPQQTPVQPRPPFSFGSSSNPTPSFSYNSQQSQWNPPPGFSPQKAFSTPEPEINDISMSTVGSETPSPKKLIDGAGPRTPGSSPLRRRYSKGELSGRDSPSPVRKSVKARDRDREREREREREERRKVATRKRSPVVDSDSSDGREDGPNSGGELQNQPTSSHFYHFQMPSQQLAPGELPYILTGYAQFFFNFSMVLVVLYVIVQFLWTVKHDVDEKVTEYSSELLHEIALCSKMYLANKCDGPRIPVSEAACRDWERCMNRDPKVIGRARVYAETMAEVVNGFVDPISWKTLFFTLITIAFGVVSLNAALSLYRARLAPGIQQSHAAQQGLLHAPPPPSPYPQPYGLLREGSQAPYGYIREGSQAPFISREMSQPPPLEWSRSWSQAPDGLPPQTPRRRSKQPQ